jgi:hypothetical protein
MSGFAKKKSKFIFYSERELKLYENGYFAYYGARSKELKVLLKPIDMLAVVLDGKNKLKIVTKEKTYLFRFNSSDLAQQWVSTINKTLNKHKV